jgi:putative ABC transport system permease protein
MRFAFMLLGVVLYVCPRDFRRSYRRSIRADFHDIASEEYAAHGLPGLLRYAVGAYLDVVTSGVRERCAMIWRDTVYAVRTLRRIPLFVAIVVGTLAIAIAANAAVFSIVDGVLLKPLPYADPQRLVDIHQTDRLNPNGLALSYPNFVDLRAHTHSFAGMTAVEKDGETLTGRSRPIVLNGQSVSASYFEVFEVTPEIGRFFTPADERRSSAHTLVLSDALYRSTFGAKPTIIGTTVYLNRDPYTIIGIAPASFHGPATFGAEPTYWTGFQPTTDDLDRGSDYLEAYGRLRPNTSIATAQADLDALMANLAQRYVDTNKHVGAHLRSLDESVLGQVRPLLFGVFAAVAGVLLVACANVANLLLSRAATRERELAVRYAIGASRTRIVAQILTETLLFALLGGVIGIALAAAAVNEFVALRPPGIPRLDTIHFDTAAAGFTFAAVVFCTLAAGVVPALSLSRLELGDALKAAGRGGDRSRGARARAAFVISEIAVTLALVVASGLVVRSFFALTNVPLGFDANGVLSMYVANLPDRAYKTDAQRIAFHRLALARAARIPGVLDTAWMATAPFSGRNYATSFEIPERPLPSGENRSAGFNMVSAGYFGVLRIPLLRGRLFDDSDRIGATPVLIVNERFAKAFYGTTAVIGKRIKPGVSEDGQGEKLYTIVGVCADTRETYATPALPRIFFADAQISFGDDGLLLVRALPTVDRAALAAIVPALDANLAPGNVAALADDLVADAARARLSALALGTLALIALLLSIAGIYAVVSYGVTQRTHEFGIRKALGARGSHVLRDVLIRAARLAALGIMGGLILAGFAARIVAGQLYGVGVIDPLTYAAVVVILFAAALIAALIPALRAMRVDPIVALRYD